MKHFHFNNQIIGFYIILIGFSSIIKKDNALPDNQTSDLKYNGSYTEEKVLNDY